MQTCVHECCLTRSHLLPCLLPPMDPPIKNGVVGDWRLDDDSEFLKHFRLPGLAEKHETLKASNPLPRDARVSFNEEKHEYSIDGVKAPRSVTGLVTLTAAGTSIRTWPSEP